MGRRGWGLLTAIAAGWGLLALTLWGAGVAHAEAAATREVCPSGCPYATLGAALAAAQDGDLITLAAGTYSETGQLLITRSLTISGLEAANPPTLRPLSDTTPLGDGRGFLVVSASGSLTLTGVTVDGQAAAIHEGLRLHGPTRLQAVQVHAIQAADAGDPFGGVVGVGIWADGGAVTLTDVSLSAIGRAGVVACGPIALTWNGGSYAGGGGRIEFGLAAGGGAQAALDGVTLAGAQATVGEQEAAGVQLGASGGGLCPGTAAARVSLNHSTLISNTVGLLIGTSDDDQAAAVIHNSRIAGNSSAGVKARNILVNQDARGNWWGCNAGANASGCDRALGTVDASSPLRLTLLPPPRARWGETLIVSATLRAEAAGATYTIPDGTPLAWQADRGTLGAARGVWSSGYAWTVWTAPQADGAAVLGVQVDAQVVTASVAVAVGTPSRLRLPLVSNALLTLPLRNSFFSDGLSGWGIGRGGFLGKGSGLPVGRVLDGTNPVARLGDPALQDYTIPVGYGSLYQTFVVEKRYLELNYRMYTADLIFGGGSLYYDTFEVSINTLPELVTDAERTGRGCQTAANPGLVVVPAAGGLVFCAGNPGSVQGKLQETGWRLATLDLAAWRGRQVTIFLTLWSREYLPAYQNDHAYYNSWVFVDNVIADNVIADNVIQTESAVNELNSLQTLWPLVLGGPEPTPGGVFPRR